MSDLISKKEVINYARKCADGYSYIELPIDAFVDGINTLPSADADGEDLIIKGAKGIQDGLYNIKDGKLFKYKAKGGTVRTYPIVPSADAEPKWNCTANFVAEQLDRLRKMTDEEKWEFFKKFFEIKGGGSE